MAKDRTVEAWCWANGLKSFIDGKNNILASTHRIESETPVTGNNKPVRLTITIHEEEDNGGI